MRSRQHLSNLLARWREPREHEPVLDETPGNGERTVENALCGGEEGKGIETVNMGTISEKWKQEKPIGHLQDETFRFVGTCVFEEKEVFVVDVLRHHWMKRLLDDVEFGPNTLRRSHGGNTASILPRESS